MGEGTRVVEARRARFLAARYPQLRGLRTVPWGVVLLLLAVTVGSVVTGTAWWVVFGLFLASVPAAAVLTWRGHLLYRRRFGEVRGRQSGWEIVVTVVFFGFLAAMFAIIRPVVGEGPVSLLGLMWAGIITYTAWRMGPFAWYRLLLAGLLGLASVLPLGLLRSDGRHPFEGDNPYLLGIAGIVLIVIGVIDHWLLVRAFGRKARSR